MSTSVVDRPAVSRRTWLRTACSAAALGAAGTVGYTWAIEPHWVETVRRDMPLVGLPSAWQGRTLLHLSDLHVGAASYDYLASAIDTAAALKPDMVVVTGDFMSYFGPEQYEQVPQLLTKLGMPPLGLFGNFGNHDYGPTWSNVKIADELERRVREIGFRILRNDVEIVDGLRLVGVEDLWCPQFRFDGARKALSGAAAGPSIALCHNPDVCDLPVWSDFRGWILSGHTHGGQCRPPFLPAPIVPIQNRRYAVGEVEVTRARRVYVSRGLGYTHRVRFNVRPEMTLFTLQTAEG